MIRVSGVYIGSQILKYQNEMKNLIWYVDIHLKNIQHIDNYDAIDVRKVQIFLMIMMDDGSTI